jgi:hypothetical protein
MKIEIFGGQNSTARGSENHAREARRAKLSHVSKDKDLTGVEYKD